MCFFHVDPQSHFGDKTHAATKPTNMSENTNPHTVHGSSWDRGEMDGGNDPAHGMAKEKKSGSGMKNRSLPTHTAALSFPFLSP